MSKYYFKQDTGIGFEDLFAGPEERVMTKNVKVKSDAQIERGMLLAEGSDSVVAPATVSDTDKPLFIASEDFEVGSDTGVVTTVYTSGRFNRSKIKVSEGVDINKFEEPLRKVDILLTDIIQLKGEY